MPELHISNNLLMSPADHDNTKCELATLPLLLYFVKLAVFRITAKGKAHVSVMKRYRSVDSIKVTCCYVLCVDVELPLCRVYS